MVLEANAKKIFENEAYKRLFSDDIVRANLTELEHLGLYHIANSYLSFINVADKLADDKNRLEFQKLADKILAAALFYVNLKRSVGGTNILIGTKRTALPSTSPRDQNQYQNMEVVPRNQQQSQQPMQQDYYYVQGGRPQ